MLPILNPTEIICFNRNSGARDEKSRGAGNSRLAGLASGLATSTSSARLARSRSTENFRLAGLCRCTLAVRTVAAVDTVSRSLVSASGGDTVRVVVLTVSTGVGAAASLSTSVLVVVVSTVTGAGDDGVGGQGRDGADDGDDLLCAGLAVDGGLGEAGRG